MSEPPADAHRTRRTWRMAAAGPAVGLVLALVSGLLGGSGTFGVAVLLLVTALGTAMAALYAIVTLLLDDMRGAPATRGRAVAAGALFVVTALLMAMVAGIGG